MPPIDTAVFQLSALALLGLILVVAVVALFRLGSLKRALAERPSTTAADVVPFAAPDGQPAETQAEPEPEERRAEPTPEERDAESRAEPDRERTPPPEEETAAAEEPTPEEAERGPVAEERGDGVETAPERAEPELVRESPRAEDAPSEETELQPEPVAAEEPEGAAPVTAGTPWPAEETPPARAEELEPEVAGDRGEAAVEGRDEHEAVGVGGDEPRGRVEAGGAATAPQPAVGDADAPGEVVAAPSTVSAQQQQVAAGTEAESEFAAERTWDDISQQTEAPANGEPSTPEPEGALTAAWAYDWARDMPEEQPIERDGRWWFKRGGELLLYDETTAQWVPAPMPDSPGGNEPAGNSNGVEFGGAAAATQSSFWKCPSCGAVNGSTASTCRMCFAARP